VVVACVGAASCSKDPDVAKREYMQSGDRYAAEQKHPEAAIEYRNAIQQDPSFGEARFKLAETNARLGDFRGAYNEYVRAADLMPTNADAQVKAAQILLLAQHFEDSKARAEKALAIDARHVDALIVKGHALAGLRDLDAAVAQIEEAIKQNPDRVASYSNLGTIETARGHQKEAEAAYLKAVATDPKSVASRLGLANFYWTAKRLDEAERALKDALAIDPKNLLTNKALGFLYVGTQRVAEAERYLKTAADVSTDGGARMTLADYYLASKRIPEAKRLLEEIAGDSPQFGSPAKLRLATLANQAGDRAAAAALVEEILAREPGDLNALLAKSELLLLDGKHDEALATSLRVVDADPQSARAQFQLGKIHAARRELTEAAAALTQAQKLQPSLLAAKIELSRVLLAQQKPDEAMIQLSEVLRTQPQDGDAQVLFARALMAKGNAAVAEPRMRQLAAEYPNSATVQAQLGRMQLMKGDLASARVTFERTLALDAANLDALGGLTSLDIRAKNTAAARARIDSRIATNRSNPDLHLLAARLYASIGDAPAAERSLREALALDSSRFEAYSMLGSLYASQRRLDDARAEFEKLAEARPSTGVGSYTLVGIIHELQNNRAAAKATYEKVMALDSRAAVAANNLAWLIAEANGDLDVALRLAQTAKAQLPERHEVNDTLGWIYYKRGLYTLAVPALVESVEAAPRNASNRYHLGMAYAKAGDNAKARESLQQALSLNPTLPEADEVKAVLASLPR
jgi:tetratricopeptide (TPR) repeat protein